MRRESESEESIWPAGKQRERASETGEDTKRSNG